MGQTAIEAPRLTLQQRSDALNQQIAAARENPLGQGEKTRRGFWDFARGTASSFGTSGIPPAAVSTGFDVLTFLSATYLIPKKGYDIVRDRKPIKPPKPNVAERFWMSMQNVVYNSERMNRVVDDWQLREKVRLQQRLLQDIQDQERAKLSMIGLTASTAFVRGALLALSEVPHTSDGLAGFGEEVAQVVHTNFAALGEATQAVVHDPRLALIPAAVVGAVGTVAGLNYLIGKNATSAAQTRLNLLPGEVEEYKRTFDETDLNIFEKGAHELGRRLRPIGKLADGAMERIAPALRRTLNRFDSDPTNDN
ncbi:MAG TPA: hypothetical protein VFQ63_03060 [Patescibacteria group bacterium]|nr:hypothetical protein [Patescibacteria group bacterium]